MSKKLGFIGCGNMGKAMIHGVLGSGKAQASDILASAKTESSREKNAAELGIRLTADNKSVAEFADILFLAVKPQYYEEVIAEIKDAVPATPHKKIFILILCCGGYYEDCLFRTSACSKEYVF